MPEQGCEAAGFFQRNQQGLRRPSILHNGAGCVQLVRDAQGFTRVLISDAAGCRFGHIRRNPQGITRPWIPSSQTVSSNFMVNIEMAVARRVEAQLLHCAELCVGPFFNYPYFPHLQGDLAFVPPHTLYGGLNNPPIPPYTGLITLNDGVRSLNNGTAAKFLARPGFLNTEEYRNEFYQDAVSNVTATITAAPGCDITTPVDARSLYSRGLISPFGSGHYTPWNLRVQGVAQYFAPYHGHTAALVFSFELDVVDRTMAIEDSILNRYTPCCDPAEVSGPHRGSHYVNNWSRYGRLSLTEYPAGWSAEQILSAVFNSAPITPYPVGFEQPDGSQTRFLGAVRGIDSGGYCEVYFDEPFTTPFDGVVPRPTGASLFYTLDPQGINSVELLGDIWGDLRLETNAEDSTWSTLLGNGDTIEEAPTGGVAWRLAKTINVPAQTIGLQGVLPEDPPHLCCNRGFNNPHDSPALQVEVAEVLLRVVPCVA